MSAQRCRCGLGVLVVLAFLLVPSTSGASIVSAPELDPSASTTGLTLLAGVSILLADRYYSRTR